MHCVQLPTLRRDDLPDRARVPAPHRVKHGGKIILGLRQQAAEIGHPAHEEDGGLRVLHRSGLQQGGAGEDLLLVEREGVQRAHSPEDDTEGLLMGGQRARLRVGNRAWLGWRSRRVAGGQGILRLSRPRASGRSVTQKEGAQCILHNVPVHPCQGCQGVRQPRLGDIRRVGGRWAGDDALPHEELKGIHEPVG
jgi:hypothetical protein